MAIHLHCDKCGNDLGASGQVLAYAEMPPTSITPAMITASILKPESNYQVVAMPDGTRKVLCDTCKAAFDALVAGF